MPGPHQDAETQGMEPLVEGTLARWFTERSARAARTSWESGDDVSHDAAAATPGAARRISHSISPTR